MKVVLVEDHALFRMGVRELLARVPGVDVVGEASTARTAFEVITAAQPDVVLMDVALPGMDGVVATREIRRRSPRVRVLILSAHGQARDVLDALDAGAAGYALKSDGPDALVLALGQVARGERYFSPEVAEHLTANQGPWRRAADVLAVLSEREREVFRLAADCRIARDIASELCIARKTVDTHLNRINRKLKLRNLAELVRLGMDLGLAHSARAPLPASEDQ